MTHRFDLALVALLSLTGCKAAVVQAERAPAPIPGAIPADELIQPGEVHFAHLWKLTAGGENAEGYWSFAGDRLTLQRRDPAQGVVCDRIFVTDPRGGPLIQVSNGRGVTTCPFFMPGDDAVLFASTHGYHDACPEPPDRSRGYVWQLHPEFDLYVRDLRRGVVTQLTDTWGYDAEATVSPRGDRIVFTSTRGGDPELWTCELDGSGLFQVTNAVGYDGGAFFSHDGEELVFRATAFSPDDRDAELQEYESLLADWLVKPTKMELFIVGADGSNRRQVTALGGANWAPYFFPDDRALVFCTNHHTPSPREFDLFAVDVDGENLRRITTYEGFDSFPMFSPDGRWLVFASNRGGATPGETNLFVAEWRRD